jgi:hypothetical protein
MSIPKLGCLLLMFYVLGRRKDDERPEKMLIFVGCYRTPNLMTWDFLLNLGCFFPLKEQPSED